MASQQQTIYVLIALVTYNLAPVAHSVTPPTVVGAYTDRATAETIARERGLHFCPALVYHHQTAEAASSDDVEDGEPEVKKTKPAKKAKAAKEGGAVKKVSKRAAVPEGDAHSLIGHTYMLAGTLHNMDHKTFMQTVEVYGGTYTNKIDDAQYLVVGANPGKKAGDAPDKGVTTIDEERFFEAIGADYPDPPAKRVKKSA